MKELLRDLTPPVITYQQKISENEIIQLQALFITPGRHWLSFSDLATARTHLYQILDSLAFYQSPTAVSLNQLDFRADLRALGAELFSAEVGEAAVGLEQLETYLMAYLNCDFLWIELAPKLRQARWFRLLSELIEQLHLAHSL